MGIKYVPKVSTVCDSFNEGKFPKLILKEVDKLLHLYLTILLTSVTAERSFSGLSLTWDLQCYKKIKLFNTSTHKESTTDLDLNLIANDFILKNSRRVQFFGK